MAIVAQVCIAAIKTKLISQGFNLNDAPKTVALVETMVDLILAEVKKGQVITTVTTPVGPGSGIGTIS